MWANLLDGLRYVRSDRTVMVMLLLAAVPGLFILNYLALLPVYARDILDIGAGGLGLLTASIGIGALVGALGAALLRPGGGSGRLLLGGLSVASLALIVFALSTWLPLSMLALAVLGGSQVAYYATTNTLIQVLVPGRLRGRVLSLYILTSWGAVPVGQSGGGRRGRALRGARGPRGRRADHAGRRDRGGGGVSPVRVVRADPALAAA